MEECLGFESSSSWMWNMSEAFSCDNDALTKALQVSLSDDSSGSTLPSESTSPAFTPRSSGPATRNPLSASSKITKRKSRASKKSPTTYITADPSNFRQMVQQVTGVRFGEPGRLDVPVDSVIRPQPQWGGAMQSTCLPTLDTSAFLLDRARMRSAAAVGPGVGEGARIGSGFEFDGFASFPTLESWGASAM